MKKTIIVLTTVFFMAATPTIAGAGRGYHRYHGHGGYYHGDSDDVWVALGIGLLTGVVLSAIFTPPPPRTVVYSNTAPAYGYPAPYPVSGTVSVTVKALNVRSGPGLHLGVIGRVRQGEVLTVLGGSPGWLNVRTPYGAVGWVMSRYTAAPVG
ncbi:MULTISPECIES: SH3 domain-containing protein [Desulfococcus]|jgi:uncharacterized protein YgiM (DUF1202 family)|uniref:SH3 domain protein n=1 Tax=Desulfococcus multivorans DSM 2059 TaxID=1121405 RepID=S7VBF3_DESML|nr:SH3 domain-containing protein [Desulfococcus multivorans]AOY57062.1 uncharacterized protein Dmul_02870 [Desulfococcus multivorans]AQU99575.1 hypothetical protein B2D07_01430 [Desulfococcus multivorans]EPR41773.1 SH3 domain protein [Desulfococcus multivorans DSM 2059]MDX9818914.1 SH3 domain-containing protein [Desulfococcus multivorans]SJZ88443.1 SH3 domain-containing protein [Desulfococcus multivorans DSM 2059]